MKNITRIFSLIMALCLCIGTMSMSAFAAETADTVEANEVDYMNYDFPEGAEVLYQGPDGVIYTSPSSSEATSEQMSTRAVEYNQVWLDAGESRISSFNVTNPHPFAGDGFGRLRLESNDSSVTMQVTVSNGGTSLYLGTTTIRVGTDVTFDFNSFSSELVIHYHTMKTSNQHGMRLNCWLS